MIGLYFFIGLCIAGILLTNDEISKDHLVTALVGGTLLWPLFAIMIILDEEDRPSAGGNT